MTGRARENAPSAPAEKAGCLAGILRVTWMAFGNLALFFAAIFAARRTAPSAFDAAYAAIVVALIIVRWIDITRCKGQTAEGKPATIAHWRRYALGLIPIAAALWAFMRFAHAKGFL